MDIAECTLNGERYHAARFARLSPKKLAELRQHLRCPDEQCHAKAQFRKASSDGRAACFVATHAQGCMIEEEYPSLGRSSQRAEAGQAAEAQRGAGDAPRGKKAARRVSTGPAQGRRGRKGRGLGSRGLLDEVAVAAQEAGVIPPSGDLLPETLPQREALSVHVATPTNVARHDVTFPDGLRRVPLVPAVIEIVLSVESAGETAVDPLQFWASRRGERIMGLPRFDLTSLARRLATDPSVAELNSIVMASGFSGFELREFLVSAADLEPAEMRGMRRAFFGTIDSARPAGLGLYLEIGRLSALLTADVAAAIKGRDLGLSDEPESWLGATVLLLATPDRIEGGRLSVCLDDGEIVAVIPAAAAEATEGDAAQDGASPSVR